MQRMIMVLWCLGLTGCIGMVDHYGDQGMIYHFDMVDACPCDTMSSPAQNAPRVVPLGPGVIPASAQVPAPPQTREPDLIMPPR